MTTVFRIERELMSRGQETPTYRVVERMGKNWYKTVMAGVTRETADKVAAELNRQVDAARTDRARRMQGQGYTR